MESGREKSISARAAEFRNPYAAKLVAYATERGEELVRKCGIEGARWVLGGSLAYDAALKGGNDIDLRLLVPGENEDGLDAKEAIDKAWRVLVEEAKGDETFETRLLEKDGERPNYIRHTRRIVKLDGVEGKVELSWNVQSKASYKSLSEVAKKLPREVIDRYVIAKGEAKAKGVEEYRAVKEEFKRYLGKMEKA